MDARLAPHVPCPLFTETCRSWSCTPGQRTHWPNVPRLRTNLQYEDEPIPHTLVQSPPLEIPQSPQHPKEKVTEMAEVKNHKRPWMIPGVGLSPACLRSSPAKPLSQAMPTPERTITNPVFTAYRPSSSVYTPAEPRTSPLYRQQAFWQTVFSSPRLGSPVHHHTTADQTMISQSNRESTIGKHSQGHNVDTLPDEVESSGSGSATTYFSDTSGIAYFLPSALSFTSSTRSSMIKNSNDLFIKTNAQSWGLGEWPDGRAVEESEINVTGTKSYQACTPSPAAMNSAHSYGWWDVLRTPFLVSTPASRASPASACGLASSMAQAQAQALKEVLLNVPSLASMSPNTITNDTGNVATLRLQKAGTNSSEDTQKHHDATDRPEPPADRHLLPPRTTSLLADALSPRHQDPQQDSWYAARSHYLMPTAAPLQPARIYTETPTQMDTHIPLPLQPHHRLPIPMPIPIPPTNLNHLHSVADPLNSSIASPLFFRTVLNPANDINTDNNNHTTAVSRPDCPPPLPPIPNTNSFHSSTVDTTRSHLPPAPGSSQNGMFSNSLERIKRDRGRQRDRNLEGMDFCCRGVPDEIVTLEFEPPPREGRHGYRAAGDEPSVKSTGRSMGKQERPKEMRRMPTVRELRETRGGQGHGVHEAARWQGHGREFGHHKEESLGKSVGRWMAGLLK